VPLGPTHYTVRPGHRRAFGVAIAICLAVCFTLPTLPATSAPTAFVAPPEARAGLIQVAAAYVPTSGVRLLGSLAPSTPLQVVAGLAPTDLSGMAAEIALVSTPGSPEYGQYLSAAQVADEFAPSPSVYERAVAYFTDRGLSVTTSADRWAVSVTGPADRLGPAFGTRFDAYSGPSGTFVEHPTPATLPASLPWSGVLGLGNGSEMQPLVTTSPAPTASAQPAASCSGGSPLAPCAVQDAYNVTSLLKAGDNGTGYTIGVVDVYDAFEPQSTLESDVSSFASSDKIPLGTIHYLYPVPTTTDLNTTYTGWGGEEALDLEWTRVMAPGATIDMTFAPDPTAGLYSSVDWLVAHQEVNVISLSWGENDVGIYNSYAGACTSACNATSDGSYAILHPVLLAAALEGISVFSASGDCGSAFGTNGVATSYPASDPYVVGVGATNLELSGTSYSSESAWSGNSSGRSSPGCQNQGGSGGGYSPFPRPTWQNATGFPASVTVRGVPDVAIVGGSGSPVAGVEDGYSTEFAGTSVSCPIWAGIAAIADQVHGSALGFLDPSLYQAARSANATKYFHDVTTGSNGYRAGKGWDPVTGLGSPVASALLPQLGNVSLVPSPLFTDISASPRSGAAALNVTFSSITYGATSSIYGFDIDFGDGNSTWSANGSATHQYASDGVYPARSVAFLTDGNSSVSPPIAIVVGGGALKVALGASSLDPADGANVTLNATVTGGTAPYQYSYSFGDGTYLSNSDLSSVVHDYPNAGTYCPVVVASDSATPPSGGASPRLPITVGGATATSCHGASSVTASISAASPIADLPGDIAFHVAASGGVPPYSVRLVSDDPYVTACSCGIFSTPGNHTVTAFVNDSQSGSTNVSMNVTLFPAIDATFSASPTIGVGSLTADFSATAIGGYETDADLTNWTFGDGSRTTGALASHTYTDPGFYVANASLSDELGWNATGSFLLDVRPSSSPDALAVNASVLPAGDSPAGEAIQFRASASGGTAPYTYHWDLGPSASAYGASASESYPVGFCPAAPGCLLDIYLNVTDASGATVHAIIPIQPAVGRPGSALQLTDSIGPSGGATPLVVGGTAAASGMPDPNITWSFGTGTLEYGAARSYQYLIPGNYTVTITATDPFGDRIVHSHAVTVTGLARTLPSISGGPATSVGVAPFLVAFNPSASGGAGPPYTFSWNFGDGATASTESVDHTYTTPGNYTANLTITDSIGTPATASYPIVVYSVTTVFVAATSPTVAVGPNSTVSVRFVTIPLCTNLSAPGCSTGPADLSVGLSGGIANRTVALNASGEATYELTAPSAAGTYLYSAIVIGVNFTGRTTFTVNVSVTPSQGPPAHVAPAAPPYAEYAAIAAVAVLAVVALTLLLVYRRRRAAAPPTP
jgi:PKD repeat protein